MANKNKKNQTRFTGSIYNKNIFKIFGKIDKKINFKKIY